MNPFAQLIGQNQAIELLSQAVAGNRIAPAYLFAGSPGVGMRLAAKDFSQLLLCADVPAENHPQTRKSLLADNHPDLFWVQPTYLHQGKRLTATEAAAAGLKRKALPQIRIEQIREVTEFLGHPPLEASRSVVVLEDAQTMAEAAANALLKTLEEPGRATLILIAPDADSLLPTLVSRCQRIPFYRLSWKNLTQVLRQNGYEAILEHPAVLAIAQGSPGEAILAWQQLQAIPEGLLEKLIQPPLTPRRALELAREIDKVLDTQAQLWLIDYLQHCYWQEARQPKMLELLEEARKSLLSYAQPRLVWECILLERNL